MTDPKELRKTAEMEADGSNMELFEKTLVEPALYGTGAMQTEAQLALEEIFMETWDEIRPKLESKGGEWYSWLMDGVDTFVQSIAETQQGHPHPLEASIKKQAEDEEGMEETTEVLRGQIAPDARVWIDKEDFNDMGYKIQQNAKKFGWDGVIMSRYGETADQFYEAVESAQAHLNTLAPEGYSFGMDDEGNWGLFEHPLDLPTSKEEVTGEIEPTLTPEEKESELEEEKDVTELTEADMPSNLKASTRQDRTLAVLRAIAQEADFEAKPGFVWVMKNGKMTYMPSSEAQQLQASERILSSVSIRSEFADEVYPTITAAIDVGDTVFIKATSQFGEVIRVLDDGVYRVKAKNKVNTLFAQEIEVRQIR